MQEKAAGGTGAKAMKTLDDLAVKYCNAKGSGWLNYMTEYEKYFAPIKDKATSILELGVGNGTSLKIWYEFFNNAKIYGVDIKPDCKSFENERTRVFIGGQQDLAFLEKMCNESGEFDIIIDDCGHIPGNQIISLDFLHSKLKRDGFYAIEDIRSDSIDSLVNHIENDLAKELEILFLCDRLYTDAAGEKKKVYLLIGRKI
jgi:SAM-dependent methyltransferase